MPERTRSRPPAERAAAPRATTRPVGQAQSAPDVTLREQADVDVAAEARQAPAMQLDQAIVTAGSSGECLITIEKFWVEVEGHFPAGFRVRTADGNALEATLEQLSYRKVHGGTGSLETALTPLAPLGTRGRLIVRDLVTGEVVEQPWTWQQMGGGSGLGFWQQIKRLIWKG